MQSIQSIHLYLRKKLLKAATPKHQPPGTKPRGGRGSSSEVAHPEHIILSCVNEKMIPFIKMKGSLH